MDSAVLQEHFDPTYIFIGNKNVALVMFVTASEPFSSGELE